jgi:hypothetical protein
VLQPAVNAFAEDTSSPPQLTADSCIAKDPFDDAYAADTESDASASPEPAATAVFDNDSEFITLDLDASVVPPTPTPTPTEGVPEHVLQIEDCVELNESPAHAVEVVQVTEPTVTAEAVQTVSRAEPAAAEQPTLEVEAVTEAPSSPSPTADVPYVVVVAPSPTADHEVSAAPVPSAEPTPSPSSPSSPKPSSSGISSSSPVLPPSSASSLAPILSWIQSSFATLKRVLPAHRGGIRWRTPICYGIAVACYSLTWYLSRRPPVNVDLEMFTMH